MPPISVLDGLLASITLDDIEALAPARRQHLAQALRRIADLADPPPKTGILGELRDGARME